MPTTRPRHQITETEEVARALEVAARRWPGESRTRLILRLVMIGSSTLAGEHDDQVAGRRAAIEATSGKYTGMFGKNPLRELREDWPE